MRKDNRNPPPIDWHDRVLILWEEDEYTRNDPDHEGINKAFLRITGIDCNREKPIAIFGEDSDYAFYLYRCGWVRICAYDGGKVGALAALIFEN